MIPPASDPLPIRRYDLDQDLCDAARRATGPLLRIACPRGVEVVLGAGSRPDLELNVDACRADQVAVLRRPGGGCAVVLDPGDVIVSVAVRVPGFGGHRAHFGAVSAWLIEGLARVGLSGAMVAGVSDLVLGDRKFAGSCLRRTRDLSYYSASLLVEPDMDLIERYLRHPPREPEYRRRRSHREFLVPLATVRPGWTADGLARNLSAALNPSRLEFARPRSAGPGSG